MGSFDPHAFFPVTVLTWSGVASVNSAYYVIARTLGASRRFLVLKVAIPAAMPHVFVGLFMGLGNSFAVLVVAEMLGVKAGLGWYLQWAQGWAAYGNMYAALLIMAFCAPDSSRCCSACATGCCPGRKVWCGGSRSPRVGNGASE